MSPSLIRSAIKAFCRVLALALLLLPALCFADRDLVVRHFGSAEGMPVSSATSAQIDADGFLWFATHDGLARFDGRRFSVFDNARFPEMGSNRVVRLYAGAKSVVYGVGTLGEWLKIDSRNIQRLRLDPANPDAKVTFITRQQPTDTDSGALCLTLSTGMYCESKSIVGISATAFYQRRKFAAHLPVAAALPSAENDWLVVPGQGIYYASAAGLALVWANPELKFTNPLMIEAKVGLDGALVIDVGEGLLKLHSDGRTRWIEADPSRQIDIVQVQLEADDSIQISTSQESYRMDASGQRTQIHAKQATEDLLQNWPASGKTEPSQWYSRGGALYRNGVRVLQSRGEIRDVLFADSGVVWVSTNRDGVYALIPARVRRVANETLNASNVYGTSMAADGTVWVASLGSGVFRIGSDDQVRRFGEADGLPGPNVWGIAVAPDQSLYGFALSSGLWQMRPGMTRFERQILPARLDRATLASISFDAQGKLWLAGSTGAWQLQSDQGITGWQQRWPDAQQSNLAALKVLCVLHDPDGRTWYGTDQGLYWQYGQQSARIEPLSNTIVRGLFRASDGALWVASEGKGLSRLAATDLGATNLTGTTLLRFGRAQGMPSNSPHAIMQDHSLNLWINSNQGIFRLTPGEVDALESGAVSTLAPMTLGLADGLIELEGNGGVQPASAMGSDGQIWFPSQRGVVRFDPSNVGAARKPGRVIIEAATAEGRALAINWLERTALQLPLGTREISVRFNAAELNAGQVRFRYRIVDGAANAALQKDAPQKAWSDAGLLTVANFDALQPGRYRFEVQAGNSDGIWNQTPALLEFDVPARFYETRGFEFALAILILLLAGFALRWQLRRLAGRALELEFMVQHRTDELSAEKARVEQTLQALATSHSELSESHLGIASRNQRLAEQATRLEALDRFRARLLTNVSHELRSPLMLVSLPLQELSERNLSAKDKRLVGLAKQQTGRLSHLVEQLLSLVQAEARQIRLNMRRIALDALVREVVAGFEPVNLQTQVRFTVHAQAELPLVYADAAQITTVLSNFLDNASKYAPIGSEVSVNLSFLPEIECLRVEVQDRGPGFSPELAEALFGRFFRTDGPPRAGREGLGVGLALAQELIVLHGGRIGAIGNAMTNGGGACFWFELPLGAAHVALEDLELDTHPEASATADDSNSAAFSQSSQPASSASLLLVEDHPELAAYLAERLAEHCPVIVVPDAETAWQHLQQQSVAIVVSDVMLPGRSGVELCQQIKADQAQAHLPVLLISAKAGKVERQIGLDAGAFDWLTKPFSLDALLSCVQRAWPNFDSLVHSAKSDSKLLSENDAEHAEPHAVQDGLLELALAQLNQATFGVPEWSERAHLSERQLRRRVTELTGMAPVAWLREQRLLKVRELITQARCRTLAEAGTMAGIDNAGYLYRLYRARFGAQ